MSHSLLIKEYITGWALHEIELNPSNFYDAQDEEELREMVWDKISDEECSNSGDFNVNTREIGYELPKEFIEEWKSLKGLK